MIFINSNKTLIVKKGLINVFDKETGELVGFVMRDLEDNFYIIKDSLTEYTEQDSYGALDTLIEVNPEYYFTTNAI